MHTRTSMVLSSLFLLLLVYACTLLSPPDNSQDVLATWVAASLTALETSPAFPTLTPTSPAAIPPNPFVTASDTPIPLPTSTPLNPLVLETILCWKGPGPQFEVVSALKKGDRVKIIGQATIVGWWIVDNPIYHDPCWAQAQYLKIEPGYDTFSLPFYTPPPTPTFTPTATRTPTRTPKPTKTP